MKRPATIDEYLAPLPREQRAALEKVRRAIRAAAPKAVECISYGMPSYQLAGKRLVMFAARKAHCAFYPMSSTTIAAHRALLKGYETSKGTIRFEPEAPLPAALVRTLVKARIAENAG